MSDTEVGRVFDEQQGRDAIHFAVLSVYSMVKVYPGQELGLMDSGKAYEVGPSVFPLGIVDPFLTHPVQPGQWFWLYLFPKTITSLRHVWTHPAVGEELAEKLPAPKKSKPKSKAKAAERDAKENEAREIIQQFANEYGLDYQEIIDAAIDYVDNGNWMSDGGRWEGMDLYEDAFWDALEVVTGRRFTSDQRGGVFSCSC